jgi:hypothetical protein
MQSPHANDATVLLQGRLLALVATFVVPCVITWYGTVTGHPPDVVVPALIIWGTGTTFWLRSAWPRLRGDNKVDSQKGSDPGTSERR